MESNPLPTEKIQLVSFLKNYFTDRLSKIETDLTKKEKKKKFYVEMGFWSLVVSIVVLAFNVRNYYKDKEITRISVIKSKINDVENYEKDVQQIYANPSTDYTSRKGANTIFIFKKSQLIDDILTELNDETVTKLGPSVLVPFCRYLGVSNMEKQAIEIASKFEKQITNKALLSQLYRDMAFWHSISTPANINKAWTYRIKDINLCKSMFGDDAISNTIMGFEDWAQCENTILKNKGNALRLLDSALLYVERLNNEQAKNNWNSQIFGDKEFVNGISYNDILNHRYKLFKNHKIVGYAVMVNNQININVFENGTLKNAVHGTILSYPTPQSNSFLFNASSMFYSFAPSASFLANGSLQVDIVSGDTLKVSYFQLGEKIINWDLIKEPNNNDMKMN